MFPGQHRTFSPLGAARPAEEPDHSRCSPRGGNELSGEQLMIGHKKAHAPLVPRAHTLNRLESTGIEDQ